MNGHILTILLMVLVAQNCNKGECVIRGIGNCCCCLLSSIVIIG
jgi:hypothetical protein